MGGFTPREVISTARYIITDNDPDGVFRQENDELVGYVNDGLREISIILPQLFLATTDLPCVPGKVEQAISFADAQVLIDVIRVKGGRFLLPADMAAMSAFNPNWAEADAGEPGNWFRHANDPLRFYLSRKAPADQVLEVKYVRSPVVVTIDDEITDVSSSFMPALANYVIYRAESKDDEHVNSGRAAAHYQAFVGLVKPA